MRQLILPVNLQEYADFKYFYANAENQQLINYLHHPTEKLIYLYAEPHNGLTHVLRALIHEKKADASLYFSFKQIKSDQVSPKILSNLEQLQLVILDDIDHIAGNLLWENAVFHIFNQILQLKKTIFIIAGHTLPVQLACALPDLQSRFQSMLFLKLNTLSDIEKLHALQLQAQSKSIALPEHVCQYLLTHTDRNMRKLCQMLDQLEKISLQEKRKITVPLVKKILALCPPRLGD